MPELETPLQKNAKSENAKRQTKAKTRKRQNTKHQTRKPENAKSPKKPKGRKHENERAQKHENSKGNLLWTWKLSELVCHISTFTRGSRFRKKKIKSGTLTERVVSVHDMCTHVCVYLYIFMYMYMLLSRHEYAMHFLLDFLDWPNPSNWGGGGSYLASWCPGHFQGEVFAFQSTWLSSFGLNTEERCTAGQIMKNMMKQCWVTGWHVSIDITIDIQVLKIRVDFIWSGLCMQVHPGAVLMAQRYRPIGPGLWRILLMMEGGLDRLELVICTALYCNM